MDNRAKTAGYVLGLIAGIFNVIYLVVGLIDYLNITGQFNIPLDADSIIWEVVAGSVLILNLIGGCVCRNKRIAGGVIMIITAGLLLINLIISMGDVYWAGVHPYALLMVIAEPLSITGAIICLSSPAKPRVSSYGQAYGQPYAQPYGKPPYGQPQPPHPPQYQPPQQPPENK